jgi:hypothetical protein
MNVFGQDIKTKHFVSLQLRMEGSMYSRQDTKS